MSNIRYHDEELEKILIVLLYCLVFFSLLPFDFFREDESNCCWSNRQNDFEINNLIQPLLYLNNAVNFFGKQWASQHISFFIEAL